MVPRLVQVEVALRDGPDGLFLIKNSTEFPGDLTLCLYKVGGNRGKRGEYDLRMILAENHQKILSKSII